MHMPPRVGLAAAMEVDAQEGGEVMECKARHAKFQPTNEEWACPKCGAGIEQFSIWEATEEAADGCELLHSDDWCSCSGCGYGAAGYKVSSALARKSSMITCPHCKGKGVVRKEEK